MSSEVNAALGNFLDLSPFERQTIRSAVPFYAWYRAITVVVGRMPLEIPGRTSIIARLGQVGTDETEQALGDIPSYLKGLIPLHVQGGQAKVFNTAPLNPFATVPQLGEDVSGTVNPFYAGVWRAILGASKYDRTSPFAAVKGFGAGVADVVGNLPQVRLGKAATGHLYQGKPGKPTLYQRDPFSEFLAYLGVPLKEINLERARELAKQEQKGR